MQQNSLVRAIRSKAGDRFPNLVMCQLIPERRKFSGCDTLRAECGVIEDAEDINISKILAILSEPIQRLNFC